MTRLKTTVEYTLTYQIPLEDTGWSLTHNIAYRTATHKVTHPKLIRSTNGDLDLNRMRQSYRNSGWTVTETDSGFRCECDGYVNEYADIRIVRF